MILPIRARLFMEFNCYDVLEVQGSRYVITEKIKYNEIIPKADQEQAYNCLLYTSPSPRDPLESRMPSSA